MTSIQQLQEHIKRLNDEKLLNQYDLYNSYHIKDIKEVIYQRLVECESPTEDLAACNQIVNLAVEIAGQVLKTKAETISENGRPVFWWGSKQPKIVLLCHLDTVWPKGSFTPTWKVNGDIATGPGVFDIVANIETQDAAKRIQYCLDLLSKN